MVVKWHFKMFKYHNLKDQSVQKIQFLVILCEFLMLFKRRNIDSILNQIWSGFKQQQDIKDYNFE